MRVRFFFIPILVSLGFKPASAQIGGRGIYSFLNMTNNARAAGLGGQLMSIRDHDPNSALQNPGNLNKEMHRSLALNYVNLFAGINAGTVSYVWGDSLKTFAAGITYLNYGTFDATDVAGNETGTFNAADYAFHFGMARDWKRFTYGAYAKVIYSQLEVYKSLGLALDLGATYHNRKNLFQGSLTMRNIGTQLTTYVPGTREPLPFQIDAGISQKLEHAPFRFIVIMHNLQTPDLTYINTNNRDVRINLETGEPEEQKIGWGEKVMRHAIVAAELVFSKNLNFRFGYNHQRRQEMALPDRRGFSGFTWGFGVRVAKIQLNYGSAGFLPGESMNVFAATFAFDDMKRKKVTAN